MESTASPNSEKTQIFKKTIEGEKEREIQLPKNRIREVIYCSFCGSLAFYFAIRGDGKIIPCCKECTLSIDKDTPWRRIIRQS